MGIAHEKKPGSQSAFFDPRVLISFAFCSTGVLLALVAFAVYSGTIALAQKPGRDQDALARPDVVPMVGPVSQDQDLRSLPYIPPNEEDKDVPLRRYPLPQTPSQERSDPVQAVRQIAQAVAMSAPIVTFDGMNSVQSGCGCLPANTHGDVGPNHYVQSVNTSIKIFGKTGAALNGVNGTTYNSLFSPMGAATPCGAGQHRGNGFVFYDHLADRWVVSDLAFAGGLPGTGPFYQCIGVSKTNDPVAGGWWLYALQVDPSNSTWEGDLPKFGMWPDAYYLSVDLFDGPTLAFKGVRVFALDRSAMINGTGVPNPVAIAFTVLPAGLGASHSLVPATFRTGLPPPAGRKEYFMAIDRPASSGVAVTQVKAWQFHVDFATPANSTFGIGANRTPDGFTTVNGFVEAFTNITNQLVPQPVTSVRLRTLGDRLMTPLTYQNLAGVESLWVSHTVNNNEGGTGPTGIRWYQFNVTGGTIPATPVQQQTFTNAADGLWRWMPSLSVDALGNMAIGYSVSSSTLEPSIRYAGRLANDPLNNLAQGEAILIAGGGHQTYPSGDWGPYSGMSIDPSDNLTFWHTNEYYSATSTAGWNTRIGSFNITQVTFTVTTTDDHDDSICDATDCTLREAINASNAQADNNVIAFAPGVTGTIQLSAALPNLSTSMVLQGTGANVVTVRRNSAAEYRIFTISNGTTTGPIVSISRLTISNGQLTDTGTLGGGIYNDAGTLTLNNCTLAGNHGYAGGGLYNGTNASATLNSCTFSGNSAYEGGAIDNAAIGGSTALTIVNSTFSANSASNNGGAITNGSFSGSATLTLTNCTFSGSTSPTGDGLNNGAVFGGTAGVIVRNTIFKTGANGANIANSGGTITSQGNNLSSDNGGGFLNQPSDQVMTDPLLGPLQNNGGPTFTHALLPGSSAINNGNEAFAPKLDQRGYLRFGTTDIGAFEFGGTPMRITSIIRLTNQHIMLEAQGVSNAGHTLQVLPDLTPSSTPIPVPVNANGTGLIQYDDAGAVGLTKRFYRLTFP